MDTPTWEERFPDLQPGKKPSGLGSVNGIGTTLIGNRDYDGEAGTYVVTHAVSLLVPIFALAAYRVANSENGWFCLGRVPLRRGRRSGTGPSLPRYRSVREGQIAGAAPRLR